MSHYSLNWLSNAFGPGFAGPDKAVLFWNNTTHHIEASANLLFDKTLKTLTLGSGGQLLLPPGASATPSIAWSDNTSTGLYEQAANRIAVVIQGDLKSMWTSDELRLKNDQKLGWTSGALTATGLDTILVRDAANTLAQRNGTNPQIFRVYGTFTDANNYERTDILTDASNHYIRGGLNAGSGTRRSFHVSAGAALYLDCQIGVGGTPRTIIFNTPQFYPNDDATLFLGLIGQRWAAGYFGGVAATIPLVVKLHASQSVNAMEVQDSGSNVLDSINPNGQLFIHPNVASGGGILVKAHATPGDWLIGTDSSNNQKVGFTSDQTMICRYAQAAARTGSYLSFDGTNIYAIANADTQSGILVRANSATQSANLQIWQNSVGTPLAFISPVGDISVKGELLATVTKTIDYTVAAGDHVVRADATSGLRTITLPAAASHSGRIIHIKKVDSSVNAVRIDGNLSELVEDATTQDLLLQGENLMLQCNGTGWDVL